MDCAYCGVTDDYETVHAVEKAQKNSGRKLVYRTLKCGNCGNYTLLMHSDNGHLNRLMDGRRIPWPRKTKKAPKEWPADVGRYWVQAKRNLEEEHWDTAAMAARSAMQLALRHKEAKGSTLAQEIKYLVDQLILPPLMNEWATEVRLLGNAGTHPKPGDVGVTSEDARDVIRFLDYLLEYLFTLPTRIANYRNRGDS